MGRNRRNAPRIDLEALPHPSLDSKRRRDSIRARWRKVIVEDFGSISRFRKAWPVGSQGQRTAETVYAFLQNEARSAAAEKHADPKLATILAFAEMTRRSAGFLLTGKGPERDGETRPRQELAADVASALIGAVHENVRDHGVRVDGLAALAFLWIKIQNTSKALAPLVELGGAINDAWTPVASRKKLVASIEAASRNATADCPGLLSLEPSVLLRQAIAIPMSGKANPALKPTVEGMLALARARAEETGMDKLLPPEGP